MLNCVVLRENLKEIHRCIHKLHGKKEEGAKCKSCRREMKMSIACSGKGEENNFTAECVEKPLRLVLKMSPGPEC